MLHVGENPKSLHRTAFLSPELVWDSGNAAGEGNRVKEKVLQAQAWNDRVGGQAGFLSLSGQTSSDKEMQNLWYESSNDISNLWGATECTLREIKDRHTDLFLINIIITVLENVQETKIRGKTDPLGQEL